MTDDGFLLNEWSSDPRAPEESIVLDEDVWETVPLMNSKRTTTVLRGGKGQRMKVSEARRLGLIPPEAEASEVETKPVPEVETTSVRGPEETTAVRPPKKARKSKPKE